MNTTTQNINEEQKLKRYKDGRNWIGNIVKDLSPVQTQEEYWSSVRPTILPEYQSLFDSTTSSIVKNILKDSSEVEKEYRFIIPLHYFTSLTEEDIKSLKPYTDSLKIKACDPGKILLAILYKKEIEHSTIDFKFSPQSIKDVFNAFWDNLFYTVQI